MARNARLCARASRRPSATHGVIFGVAYLVVRAMHIALYALAAAATRDLLGAVLRMVPSSTISGFLILGAAASSKAEERTTLWILALAIDYLGVLIGRGQGWRLSPGHFVRAARPRRDHRDRRVDRRPRREPRPERR